MKNFLFGDIFKNEIDQLQTRRDFFGAHTYDRVDRPRGQFFLTDWTGEGGDVTSGTYDA